MGDMRYVSITIGGEFTTKQLKDFQDLLANQELELDEVTDESNPQLIIEKCNYGETHEITRFLQDNKHPYFKNVDSGDDDAWCEQFLNDTFGVRLRDVANHSVVVGMTEIHEASQDPIKLLALFEEAAWWKKDLPAFKLTQ